ncbi:Berberine bridge enzyme-like 21 [Fusarium oxysporum f. sp. albedinis]|nr:Berberine bridge enzyme-like 21 [Fusarium oxysporum f. sp. albedinis]
MMKGLVRLLAISSTLARVASAKAVFAHYMVGTVTQEHAHKDIDNAKSMGLDGFALNIGDATRDYVSQALSYLFPYAESVGFKLYISMDVYASGDACYHGAKSSQCHGPSDYQWIWDFYKGSSAYYQVKGRPLISTFSSGGFHNDTWIDWKKGLANDTFFMPDFDETEGYYDSADEWWSYWGPIVDGIFSWESAWPERKGFGGKYAGDVSIDVPVLSGAHKHDKLYMMGLSPLQYKNAYGAHVYRQGDLNLPKRMINILNMDPQPDYVQFQTWNDGPEAHYIGNLWTEQNNDTEPYFYANQETWDHTGWQPLVSSFVNAYKTGQSASQMTPMNGDVLVGAAWYRTELSDVKCPYEGNDAYYNKPDGWDDDVNYLYYAIILNPSYGSGYKVTVSGSTEHTAPLNPGMNYGYGAGEVQTGAQQITVKDPSGNVIYTATGGMCVSDGCPNYIYNGNYQVLPLKKGNVDPVCNQWPGMDHSVCGYGTCHASGDGGNNAAGDDFTHVTCTNPGVTDASKDAKFCWDSVYADQAWTWGVDQWNANPFPGGLNFTEQFSNLFHGPEGIDCGTIENDNPCGSNVVQCNDVTYPGAYFAINSMESIYRVHFNFWDALDRAQNDINAQVGEVSSTFAPIKSSDFSVKLLLDIIGLGFSLAVSPMWNSALKGMPYFKANPNTLATVKDWVNPMVTNSITIAKDTLKDDSALSAENSISTRLNAIVTIWQAEIVSMNEQLFNGSKENTDLLFTAITDGQMLETKHQDIGVDAIQAFVSKALFAELVPLAWQLSSSELGPVVIDSEQGCGDKPDVKHMSSKSYGSSGVCVDSKMYYLIGCTGEARTCDESHGSFNPGCTDNFFSSLPGLDDLTGSETAFGGLTKEDIVNGAVNSFAGNGNANGWSMLDPSNTVDGMDLVSEYNVTAPGVVMLPVCTASEAFLNWFSFTNGKPKSANYPCN